MSEVEHKEIELRSEEVQEVMDQIPPWILRWGITVLFLVVLSILIGSFFFKYPDVISTQMTLTSQKPVASIVARSSGRLSKVYVKDGQQVRMNDPLAIIENPAITEDVEFLEKLLIRSGFSPEEAVANLLPAKDLSLGDIQGDYTNYLKSLHDYLNYQSLEYYPKKIASVKGQIDRYRVYYQNQARQHEVIKSQYEIAYQQYQRDSLLFVRQVISPSEHESAKNELLQSRYSLEGSFATLENLNIQIAQLEESLLDLELQQVERETVIMQEYRTATDQLHNSMNSWRLNYCLISPIEGVVTFTKYWNENQTITAGESVFSVVPDKEVEMIGVSMLPLARSGKVKSGQRVLIRFANYPDQEFGLVNGRIAGISLVPAEDNYRVEIELPDGLRTNYGKELPVSQEMQATAEIVTEDLRLIERFFQPLKKILKEGFQEP